MEENNEVFKRLLMEEKEESTKGSLKLNIQKMKIVASGPITPWQIDMEMMTNFIFFFFLTLFYF